MTVSIQFGLVYKMKSNKNKTLNVQAGIIDITVLSFGEDLSINVFGYSSVLGFSC